MRYRYSQVGWGVWGRGRAHEGVTESIRLRGVRWGTEVSLQSGRRRGERVRMLF